MVLGNFPDGGSDHGIDAAWFLLYFGQFVCYAHVMTDYSCFISIFYVIPSLLKTAAAQVLFVVLD